MKTRLRTDLQWLLVAICLCYSGRSLAQSQQNAVMPPAPVLAPAPNAASLGKYGDVPVSTYTGLPSISVPLHSIQTKSHQVDISLSYHASGIRVQEEASVVGLGWALNAGGVITRSVRGNDDLSTLASAIGYVYSGPLPPSNPLTHQYDGTSPAALPTDGNYFVESCAGQQDLQPDLFYYNVAGYTGKFVLVKSLTAPFYEVRLLEKSNKIIIKWNAQGGWTLTAANGYRYAFNRVEGTTTTTEISTLPSPSSSNPPSTTYSSAWYLTTITAPDGEVVTFEYIDSNTCSQLSLSETVKKYVGQNRESVSGTCPSQSPGTSENYVSLAHSYSFTNGAILKKIHYANGVVEFLTAPRQDISSSYRGSTTLADGLRITGFVIRSTYGPQQREAKRINFVQSYFNSGAATPSFETRRLKLDQVIESANGQAKPPHVFTYYDSSPLPNKTSLDQDHYGYFNNAGNIWLIPSIPVPAYPSMSVVFPAPVPSPPQPSIQPQTYGNRNPDINFMRLGTLRQITYPTGGTTLFEYEPHDYYGTSTAGGPATNKPSCGLRIQRISSRPDATATARIQKFIYTKIDPGASLLSSGKAMSRHDDTYYFEHHGNWQPFGCSGGQERYVYWWLILTSQSNTPLGTAAQGQPVGYDAVTVLEGENGENGKTVYEYENEQEQFATYPYIPNTPNNLPLKNGLLKQQTVYKRTAANTFQKVRRVINTYLTTENASIRGAVMSPVACRSSTTPSSIYNSVKFYDNMQHWTRMATTEEQVYDQDDDRRFTTTLTTHTYGNAAHRQLTLAQKTLSDGTVVKTHFAYPADYTALSSGPVFAMASDAVHNHSTPVETFSTILRNGNEEVTGGQYTAFTVTGPNNLTVLPQRVMQLKLATPLRLANFTRSTAAASATPGVPQIDGRYLPPYQHFTYEASSSNLCSTQKDNAPATSYQWGYNRQLPVAVFVNASRIAPVPAFPALGNEASYLGFESGVVGPANPAEDYWNTLATTKNFLVKGSAHAGDWAWEMGPQDANPNFGPGRTFAPAGQQLRYRLSAWVKASAAFTPNGGKLVLSVNRANGTPLNYGVYPDGYKATSFDDNGSNGKWHYVEVTIDLGAVHNATGILPSAESFQVSAYTYSTATGTYQIDDIRFQPVDSQATTYAYDVATRQPVGVGDANSKFTYYEYDGLSRLKVVRDYLGQILKQYQYNYKQ